MGVTAELQVGPRYMADGSDSEVRQGRTGEMVVTMAHAALAEAAQRGKLFHGSTVATGTTIVSGNVSPVGAGAASILSIYNPVGSGVLAVVHRLIVNNISGTPNGTAMTLDAAYNQVITATPNNAGVSGAYPTNAFAGGNSGSVICYTQTALTGSSAHTFFRILGINALASAISATTPDQVKLEIFDGELVLPPGGILTLGAGGTGTSHVIAASFTWEEVSQ